MRHVLLALFLIVLFEQVFDLGVLAPVKALLLLVILTATFAFGHHRIQRFIALFGSVAALAAIQLLSFATIQTPIRLVSSSILFNAACALAIFDQYQRIPLAARGKLRNRLCTLITLLAVARVIAIISLYLGNEFLFDLYDRIGGGTFLGIHRIQYGHEFIFVCYLVAIVNVVKIERLRAIIVTTSGLLSFSRVYSIFYALYLLIILKASRSLWVWLSISTLATAAFSILVSILSERNIDAIDVDPRVFYFDFLFDRSRLKLWGDYGLTYLSLLKETGLDRLEVETLLLISELGILIIPFLAFLLYSILIPENRRYVNTSALLLLAMLFGTVNPIFTSISFGVGMAIYLIFSQREISVERPYR